jgi:hypothetical protein
MQQSQREAAIMGAGGLRIGDYLAGNHGYMTGVSGD